LHLSLSEFRDVRESFAASDGAAQYSATSAMNVTDSLLDARFTSTLDRMRRQKHYSSTESWTRSAYTTVESVAELDRLQADLRSEGAHSDAPRGARAGRVFVFSPAELGPLPPGRRALAVQCDLLPGRVHRVAHMRAHNRRADGTDSTECTETKCIIIFDVSQILPR
jgi:hypothetical protein